MLFHFLKTVLKLFYRKPEWEECNDVRHSPAIYVTNHNLSYGPVIFFLYAPFTAHPWVIAPVTQIKECRSYIRKDFIEKELGIYGFTGKMLAFAISFICVWIMRRVHAVPVYSSSRKICITMQKSLEELLAGNHLVIFIERREDQNYAPDTGFLELMDSYYRATGNCLPVYILKISRRSVKLVGTFHDIPQHARIRERVIQLLREINEG